MQLGGKNLIFPLNKQAIKILKRVGHWRTKTKSRFKRNENPQTRNWSLQIARHAERSINKNKANKNQSFRTLNKERTNLNRSFGSSNDRNFCSLEIKATNQICRNKHKLPGDRAATQMNKEVGSEEKTADVASPSSLPPRPLFLSAEELEDFVANSLSYYFSPTYSVRSSNYRLRHQRWL